MEFGWLLEKLDAFITGLSGALGVGAGIAAIVWLARTFLEEKIKAAYERERLAIAHKQKVVETMVVQLHEYAKNYYMPVVTAIAGFASYLRDDNYDYAFNGLIDYVLAQGHIWSQLHGYFLQDVVAERIVATLEEDFWHGNVVGDGFMGQGEGVLLAKVLKPGMTTRDFIEKVQGHHSLNEIYEKFKRAAQDEEKKRRIILRAETIVQVFQLEINLPYQAWYGRLPSHVGQENLSLLENERSRFKEKELTDKEIDSYLEKIRQFRV